MNFIVQNGTLRKMPSFIPYLLFGLAGSPQPQRTAKPAAERNFKQQERGCKNESFKKMGSQNPANTAAKPNLKIEQRGRNKNNGEC